MVTGIRLREPALNVNVHDNLIRNCGQGILTERGQATVGERALNPKNRVFRVQTPVDDRTFLRAESPSGLPLERARPWQCSGWSLAWQSGSKPKTVSIIDSFDPDTLRFKLREPHEMKPGDRFEVIAPSVNWNIHDNTIRSCLKPVVLDSYGSETSFFKDNIITRGETTGVKAAVEVHGRFNLIGNHISGFDEKDSSALALYPDALGRVSRNLYRDNIFERCANMVAESQKGLWGASAKESNLTVDSDEEKK